MSKESYQDWVEYYRIQATKGGNLRQVSGYTHGLAQLTEKGLRDITDTANNFLDLKSTDRLLDLGCGAGLLTQHLVDKVGGLVGLDANREMMIHAAGEREFVRVEAMADHLPFRNAIFDKIFCHSIFQYFPDYFYAAAVIAEMRRVLRPGGRGLIMDIPDLAKKEAYMSVKTPDTHTLERLFYTKEWFSEVVPDAHIFERTITDYGNSHFRFDALIQR